MRLSTSRCLPGWGCFLSAAALLLAGTTLPAQVPVVEPAKKEPAKPPTLTEAEVLKQALDHLRQFGDLTQRLQDAAARAKCAENLRQIRLAIPQTANTFPPAVSAGAVQQPSANWATQILPYIPQDNLYSTQGTGRLNAPVEPVSAALASQLDLPKGQGLVIGPIAPASAAAKAGLQVHDILLQFNGRPVSRDPAEFIKSLEGLPPKTAFDAVVLRKGKRVEVKGIILTGAPVPPVKDYRTPARAADGTSHSVQVTDGTSNTILIAERAGASWDGSTHGQVQRQGTPGGAAEWWGASWDGSTGSAVLTTTFRQQDRFTTRYQEGSLIITIIGKLAKGPPTVGQIKVQDGTVENRYAALEKVPPEYQDKARDLLEVSAKGQGQIEIKKP